MAFFFLLLAATSPWTLYNGVSKDGKFFSLGAGPFVAGSISNTVIVGGLDYYEGKVWWGDLNSANVCDGPGEGMLPWTEKNNLCTDDKKFIMPTESQAIQASIVLATILSFMSCVSGFSLGRSGASGGGVAACTSFLAMIFASVAFSLWLTWPMSIRLRSFENEAYLSGTQDGDYVPVWASITSKGQHAIALSPVPIRMGFGWTFVTTILSFVLLLFSTATFSSVAKQMSEADAGDFGKGI